MTKTLDEHFADLIVHDMFLYKAKTLRRVNRDRKPIFKRMEPKGFLSLGMDPKLAWRCATASRIDIPRNMALTFIVLPDHRPAVSLLDNTNPAQATEPKKLQRQDSNNGDINCTSESP